MVTDVTGIKTCLRLRRTFCVLFKLSARVVNREGSHSGVYIVFQETRKHNYVDQMPKTVHWPHVGTFSFCCRLQPAGVVVIVVVFVVVVVRK